MIVPEESRINFNANATACEAICLLKLLKVDSQEPLRVLCAWPRELPLVCAKHSWSSGHVLIGSSARSCLNTRSKRAVLGLKDAMLMLSILQVQLRIIFRRIIVFKRCFVLVRLLGYCLLANTCLLHSVRLCFELHLWWRRCLIVKSTAFCTEHDGIAGALYLKLRLLHCLVLKTILIIILHVLDLSSTLLLSIINNQRL